MTVLQQADTQIGERSESASFEAENCQGIDLIPGYSTTCVTESQQAWTPTLEATKSNFQELGSLDLPAYTFSPGVSQSTNDERSSSLVVHDFQLSEHGIFSTTRDPFMSFRDRHRFLDRVYNSYSDPALITAEDMGDVARKVGLLMEEVLSWFKDEKSRRAELLAHHPHQTQKSACQLPPSPESIRGNGEVSPASSSCNATSPGTPSKPQDISSPCLSSADQRTPAPPKAKRGRPAKTHVKVEQNLPSPDSKRMRISVKYPCPDCQNFVPVERWAEHVNRKHFPKHVWECPKINRQTGKPCSSSSHYRLVYRDDNFATHLKGEHKCPDTEVTELKKTCKYEVTNFFHKICGFCDKSLDSREESLEHIKDHFRKAFEEPNPPSDLGVSLWREKCGVEHKLQLGIHYRRSQASKTDPTDENDNHDRDEDDNGGSGDGNSENSTHDNSEFRSNNNSHDHDTDENGASGDGNSDTPCRDNSAYQSNNNSHIHDHYADSRSSQDSLVNSCDPQIIDSTSFRDQPSIGRAKMDSVNASDLPVISSLLHCFDDGRSESQDTDGSNAQAPRSPTGVPRTRTPRRLTAKEEANFQCHVEGCGKLFNLSYNFKAHLKTHDETREHTFPCGVKDCDKEFDRMTDLGRHQNAHEVQRNRCEQCSRVFVREGTLTRHLEDGCPKHSGLETSFGASTDDNAHQILFLPLGSCMADVDFPLSPHPATLFQAKKPQEAYPKPTWCSSSTNYAEAPQYTMESPGLRASNYSSQSDGSAKSSAVDSPFSSPTRQSSTWTPELRSYSSSSTVPGLSAASPSMGSPHSIHGQIVRVPEYGLGSTPSIASYDTFGPSNEYNFSYSGMDDFTLDCNPSKLNFNRIVDPLILHPPYLALPTSAAHSSYSSYPYRPSTISGQSQSGSADFSSEKHIEKGRCTYLDCGKVFQDLKAHILTHQNERPQKCPIQKCDYHIKGFARKYDKNRHTLTHYKGTMVCGFCLGTGSVAEKSFNRVDVFKRHLTSVHGVEQTPPSSRKKTSGNSNSAKILSGFAPDATNICSTCSGNFGNAQVFYDHLDDCVLRFLQQEEPSEAVNAIRLAEIEEHQSVYHTPRDDAVPTTTTVLFMNEDQNGEEFEDDNKNNFLSPSQKNQPNSVGKPRVFKEIRTRITRNNKDRKKRKDYPSSRGSHSSQSKVKNAPARF